MTDVWRREASVMEETTMLTDAELAEAGRIAAAATGGPWYARRDYYGGPSVRTRDDDNENITGEGSVFQNSGRGSGDASLEDAAHIAQWDPEFAKRVLAHITEQEAEIARLKATARRDKELLLAMKGPVSLN